MPAHQPIAPLAGVRILSLSLNLPGPAALMRCRQMGAECAKLEPPPQPGHASSDPMGIYCPEAYATMHAGVRVLHTNLKAAEGQALVAAELAQTDVLLTSFRPSALAKLGLAWEALHARYPRLSLVRIVGSPGTAAEEPGHDLTYMAQVGLVTGTELPPTLFADMGGALMASEAVLQAQLARAQTGVGCCIDVALSDAAAWLGLPRHWGLTTAQGDVGGKHAGYRVYHCADGRVALAALEPHFAGRLFALVQLPPHTDPHAPDVHQATAAWLRGKSRQELDAIASEQDLPLYTMA